MIYIPIWIDLKAPACKHRKITSEIYIPIWIDLKVNTITIINGRIKNLHSNMDRFESGLAYWIFEKAYNLHSNMDRFEREVADTFKISQTHLHSNMDRFERHFA